MDLALSIIKRQLYLGISQKKKALHNLDCTGKK